MLELIDSYLNGPRTLSNSRLSYLVLSEAVRDGEAMPTPPRTPSPVGSADSLGADEEEPVPEANEPSSRRQFELLICAMHFLGDGMALHAFANDFFGLLGGERSDEDLRQMLHDEWHARWADAPEEVGDCV